jgi:hypothetical protein
VGRAALLVDGGPPPSLRSALHSASIDWGETTGRVRRCRSSAQRNTNLCCLWIQAARDR